MKKTLTIEESTRLIELDVDTKLASKCWISSPSNREEKVLAEHDPFYYELFVNPEPVFTLTDILSILPKEIDNRDLGMEYDSKFEQWCVGYNILHLESSPELIDALNSLLIWCITEKKIKL